MKLPLLATLFFVFALTCAAQPLRVLYLGTPDRTPRMNAHVLMRDLGRDAIWFDYVYDPAAATPAFVAKFDLIVLDAPADIYTKALAVMPATNVLAAAALGDSAAEGFALAAKAKLLAALSPARIAGWEKFLAQREPEKREARPTIANYEKRPEPVTFQFPLRGQRQRRAHPGRPRSPPRALRRRARHR